MTWRPHGVDRVGRHARPQVGDVVAYDRAAYEVTHVSDATPTPKEEERLAGYQDTYRARMAPYRVTVKRLYGPRNEEHENDRQERGLRIPVGAFDPLPQYRHGRVPLCSCHGHPWPCLEADQQADAAVAAQRMERELALLPGCCPACQEPITARQKTIEFPGEYVRNPLADPHPRFHLRRKCWQGAAKYEEEWVAAWPGRARSLLTLSCTGTRVVHADGTGECHGRNDGTDCPSLYARHPRMTTCYGDCPTCPPGQPPHGCHLPGYPADPRDIHGTGATR